MRPLLIAHNIIIIIIPQSTSGYIQRVLITLLIKVFSAFHIIKRYYIRVFPDYKVDRHQQLQETYQEIPSFHFPAHLTV